MNEMEYYVSYVKDKEGDLWSTGPKFDDAFKAHDYAKRYLSEDGTDEIVVYRHLVERVDL